MKISLKTSQKISLEILKVVTSACEELNLNYFLMYGTLIGAVRHKGFIPWDDDVDIMMPRKDYTALIKAFSKDPSLLHGLDIFSPLTSSKYPYMITRISDPNYKIKRDNEEAYGMGIFIDIYPFDGLGNNIYKALEIQALGDGLSSLYYLSTRDKFTKDHTKGILKNTLKYPSYLVSKSIGKTTLQKSLLKLANDKFYSSKYVCCATWTAGGEKDLFKRSWFDEYIYLPFEGQNFRVPKCYDEVLKHIYGDYMKLPPKSKQIGHHYYMVL
ncbi:MAG: LicD family protein [Lactobacillaceae bacterium]|nr:LicD family protein [Lactobacillaceae bacterium]